MRKYFLNLLMVTSAVCFMLGLFLTAFVIKPSFGIMVDALIVDLSPETLEPQSYSILSGIKKLFVSGDYFLAIVLTLFSCIFPCFKIVFQSYKLCYHNKTNKAKENGPTLSEQLATWSMLDVFFVSILVTGFKQFPGGTRIEAGIGSYFFAASVVGLLLVQLIHNRGMKHEE